MNQEKKKKNEEKKKYLRTYRKHGKKIRRIEKEIEEIRSMKMYPSMNNDGMPHGSSGSGDLSGYAAELMEKENTLYEEGVEQVKAYSAISAKIKELENEEERDVLFYRYIAGMDWWKIAQEMECSERWVYELHGRALEKLKNI